MAHIFVLVTLVHCFLTLNVMYTAFYEYENLCRRASDYIGVVTTSVIFIDCGYLYLFSCHNRWLLQIQLIIKFITGICVLTDIYSSVSLMRLCANHLIPQFTTHRTIAKIESMNSDKKWTFYKAKEFKVANKFENLWIKDQKIFLKKDAESKTGVLTSQVWVWLKETFIRRCLLVFFYDFMLNMHNLNDLIKFLSLCRRGEISVLYVVLCGHVWDFVPVDQPNE